MSIVSRPDCGKKVLLYSIETKYCLCISTLHLEVQLGDVMTTHKTVTITVLSYAAVDILLLHSQHPTSAILSILPLVFWEIIQPQLSSFGMSMDEPQVFYKWRGQTQCSGHHYISRVSGLHEMTCFNECWYIGANIFKYIILTDFFVKIVHLDIKQQMLL